MPKYNESELSKMNINHSISYFDMKFESLTNLCNATIKFSEKMIDAKAGFNLTWLLEGGIKIYMELS